MRKLALISLLFMSLACSVNGGLVVGNFGTEHADLYEAFKRYWSARSQLKYEECFYMEAPYLQELYIRNLYKGYLRWFNSGGLIKKITIKKLNCKKPFYCCIDMDLLFVLGKKEKRVKKSDCWVKAGGKWWHLTRNPFVGPVI